MNRSACKLANFDSVTAASTLPSPFEREWGECGSRLSAGTLLGHLREFLVWFESSRRAQAAAPAPRPSFRSHPGFGAESIHPLRGPPLFLSRKSLFLNRFTRDLPKPDITSGGTSSIDPQSRVDGVAAGTLGTLKAESGEAASPSAPRLSRACGQAPRRSSSRETPWCSSAGGGSPDRGSGQGRFARRSPPSTLPGRRKRPVRGGPHRMAGLRAPQSPRTRDNRRFSRSRTTGGRARNPRDPRRCEARNWRESAVQCTLRGATLWIAPSPRLRRD